MKCFFSDNIVNDIINQINATKLKKIDSQSLQIHSEEYDPFLVEKFTQLFQTSKPNFNNKKTIKWISENFIKTYEEAEHHWLKFLSQ